MRQQKGYWKNVISKYEYLPTDYDAITATTFKDILNRPVYLTEQETHDLLHSIHAVYNTEINDILISALVKTLYDWTEKNNIVIGMEGHGRESISDEVDVSRTTGWFTNIYPALFEWKSVMLNDAELIINVKETIRRIPDKGIGYNVLKFINKDLDLQGKSPWDIIWNYFGQFDNMISTDSWLVESNDLFVNNVNENFEIEEKILLNCLVKTWSTPFALLMPLCPMKRPETNLFVCLVCGME